MKPSWRGRLALLALILLPLHAQSASTLTYEPYGLVHNRQSPEKVDRFLAELDAYGIGAAFLQTPAFNRKGILPLPQRDLTMLTLWAKQAKSYNAAHATNIMVTAIFNGEVDSSVLDLDNPATRARMVAGIELVLTTGISAVHLDLEPYPVTPGFLALLDEVNAAFARQGLTRHLSVVAPGYAERWTPGYLRQISERVSEINPLYYDSGISDVTAYKSWMVRSLRYYTANVGATTEIIPVIPSYSANPWHRPSVENIETATAALSTALAEGNRVNGAGIWWWWGFYYDEEGAYDASADRIAWQSITLGLPFSP